MSNNQKTKILEFISSCLENIDLDFVNIDEIIDNVLSGLSDGISDHDLEMLLAQTAAYSVTKHPDYGLLGGRLAVKSLHKSTSSSVLETFSKLYNNINFKIEKKAPLISEEVMDVISKNHNYLQRIIDYSRDFVYDYFGYKTMEKSYLLKIEDEKGFNIVERPQHMWMRVAIGIHGNDLDSVKETYDLLSNGYFTHATPTLFNAGTPKPQMSSCFLVAMKDDSIEGIYDTIKECALISKTAGGIGVHCHNIRSSGSYIAGSNGTSDGIVPMLRVLNNTARYINQGGKRKGAFAVYLEPWHPDIHDFLLLKKSSGKDEVRARDLFYGLWIPDLFMKRVEKNENWTLFDPHACPGLSDCYGEEFEELYTRYEKQNKGTKTIKAQDLWFSILEMQIETGTPYMLYKDACNSKSNQKNRGVIKCSNLCTEIIEYTSPEETAVCNLASVSLPKFLLQCVRQRRDSDEGTEKYYEFDHYKLHQVVKIMTKNLNKIIDKNYYPTDACKISNFKNRPIGIGVQGLADVFIMMKIPFTSPRAKKLNEDIFETIYHAACEESIELAKKDSPYLTYPGSPTSEGLLQFDLWNEIPKSVRWDWVTLKENMQKYGIRNSLLTAPMPTASTSQILGNNECFEPYTSNIYLRRVLSGEFPVINKHLVKDLIEINLWNDDIRNKIIKDNGSIQNILQIPENIRKIYLTVWEMKMKDIIDMSADRGKYIDQSQSLNLFLQSPKTAQLTSMHFYAWKKGLKTGMYYLRTKPATDAIKFTVKEDCDTCGS